MSTETQPLVGAAAGVSATAAVPAGSAPAAKNVAGIGAGSSGCCSWKCCCGGVCAFFAVLGVALLILIWTTRAASTFVIFDTTYTYDNYFLPMTAYMGLGLLDTVSMMGWYEGLTVDNPMIGEGPGPNTQTFYAWHDVRDLLLDFGPRIKNGTMQRYNELGMAVQNDRMWPETKTIALGYSNKDHALVRPYLGNSLDGSREEDADCDGSTCWNSAWLRQVFRERFASTDTLSTSDLPWLVTVVLHKVHLNLDLTDEEAQDFAAFMTTFIVPQPLAPEIAYWTLTDFLLQISSTLEQKAAIMSRTKEAIKAKWPKEGWESKEEELTLHPLGNYFFCLSKRILKNTIFLLRF